MVMRLCQKQAVGADVSPQKLPANKGVLPRSNDMSPKWIIKDDEFWVRHEQDEELAERELMRKSGGMRDAV